jgi:hypothetical protein
MDMHLSTRLGRDGAKRKRRSSRARERGAALVEAAFMMPMFVILFFTSLYAHNLNAKQISLNITTRSQAWALAMYNCSKGPGTGSPAEGETLQAANSGGSGEPTTIGLTSQNANDASSAAGSAFNSGSISGSMSSMLSIVTGLLSDILPNPQGAQSQIKDTVSWRMPNTYVAGGATSGPNSTPVQQTVTVVCNEQEQNGSIGSALKSMVCVITGLMC